ncbi:MAG: hypothetical protein U9N35_03305 [Euryarchaeota archaeon]|nr:hypothetical protein [Euryarchaeota archaeon]
MDKEDIPSKEKWEEREEIQLDWKDYVAFFLALLQTAFLPFILFIIVLLVFVFVIMII